MSAQPAHQRPATSDQPRSEFVNRLPAWILGHARFDQLSAGERHTLRAIANRCNQPPEVGTPDLIGAYGGQSLYDQAGVSRRTFFRHLAQLERPPAFVVMVRRIKRAKGGSVNVYGVPGAPGSLDHVKVARHMQQQQHVGGGVYKPVRTERGQQSPLFGALEAFGAEDEASSSIGQQPEPGITTEPTPEPPVSCDDGSPCHYAPCHSDTTRRVNLTHNHPPDQRPGPAPGGGSRPNSWKSRTTTCAELQQGDCLHLLFRMAVDAGVIPNVEAMKVVFAAAAAHAVRITKRDGGNAGALFRATVEQLHKPEVRQRITNEDEHRGWAVWKGTCDA